MNNKQIYKKTLVFSIKRALWDILSLVLLLGLGTLGYFIADKTAQNGPIGLLIGILIGIVVVILIMRFISYLLKAGQIAMMTRGITEGALPENVYAEGKKEVKERFATVAVLFALTGAIRAIFNQLGRGITKVGESLGGDTGGAIGGAVSSVLQTVVNYLCDCCLGWVFYRKEVKPAKAACEGAALYFKHGKTLFKNMGRVFGIGIVSFLAIGGAFTGIFYLIISGHREFYAQLAAEIASHLSDSTSTFAQWLQDPNALPIVFSVLGGIIIWSILHSVFIKPYVLVGVLRNYIDSGKNDIPSEDSFAVLDAKSAKFRKLHKEI
ncbi:MAG: hypothetical protein IJL41_00410 [Clostridia bacterium]|nr:hypothetical protein [Clostridia bacterium]